MARPTGQPSGFASSAHAARWSPARRAQLGGEPAGWRCRQRWRSWPGYGRCFTRRPIRSMRSRECCGSWRRRWSVVWRHGRPSRTSVEHLDPLCISSRGRTAVEFTYVKRAWSGTLGAGPTTPPPPAAAPCLKPPTTPRALTTAASELRDGTGPQRARVRAISLTGELSNQAVVVVHHQPTSAPTDERRHRPERATDRARRRFGPTAVSGSVARRTVTRNLGRAANKERPADCPGRQAHSITVPGPRNPLRAVAGARQWSSESAPRYPSGTPLTRMTSPSMLSVRSLAISR